MRNKLRALIAAAVLGAAGGAQAAHLRAPPGDVRPDEVAPPPPLPSGFVIIARQGEAAADCRTPEPVATPHEASTRILSCWRPPAARSPDGDREVTLRVQFTRAGAPIGAPRIAYVKTRDGPQAREALAASVLDALHASAPLRFTKGLGSAIAGYQFAIRFIAARPRS